MKIKIKTVILQSKMFASRFGEYVVITTFTLKSSYDNKI